MTAADILETYVFLYASYPVLGSSSQIFVLRFGMSSA